MSALGILFNIGAVIGVIRALIGLVKEVAEKKSLPECQNVDTTLTAIEKLFSKNVVKVGNLKNEDIADAINQIRDQLKCSKP